LKVKLPNRLQGSKTSHVSKESSGIQKSKILV